jgi:hypothetical protein
MKITENNNYGQYLKGRLVDLFSKTTNYIYGGLIIIGLGLYWYKHDVLTTLKIFTTMTNGFMVTFLLTEIALTLMYKEFKRNKYITYILTIATLTTINIIYLNNTTLYWSFATGLIFFAPVIILLTLNKLNIWRR